MFVSQRATNDKSYGTIITYVIFCATIVAVFSI